MKTEFSIIIPVFNAEETLEETLATVKAQSYPHFEVVIVNDGSIDGSAEIIENWKNRLEQPVKVVDQENLGLGAARNAGVQAATKAWLALLDADDLWKTRKLEKMAAFMENHAAGLCYHQVENFGAGARRKRKIYHLKKIEELLQRGSPIVPSATVIKREWLMEFPFSERRDYVEDLPLWIKLLDADKTFAMLPEVLGCYREGSGLSSNIQVHLQNVLNVLNDLHDEGLFDGKLLEIAKRRKYLEAARHLQKRKDFDEAQRYYSMADFKSMKITGLRFLSWLGVPV